MQTNHLGVWSFLKNKTMKDDKFKIKDASSDRKYFAMIPYFIVNHSCVYEQSLYLVMKRIASEQGTCWASPQTIAKMMDVAPNTVRKYRKKLEQRGGSPWLEPMREWIKDASTLDEIAKGDDLPSKKSSART